MRKPILPWPAPISQMYTGSSAAADDDGDAARSPADDRCGSAGYSASSSLSLSSWPRWARFRAYQSCMNERMSLA